jgi:hypothetical protein
MKANSLYQKEKEREQKQTLSKMKEYLSIPERNQKMGGESGIMKRFISPPLS